MYATVASFSQYVETIERDYNGSIYDRLKLLFKEKIVFVLLKKLKEGGQNGRVMNAIYDMRE